MLEERIWSHGIAHWVGTIILYVFQDPLPTLPTNFLHIILPFAKCLPRPIFPIMYFKVPFFKNIF